MTTPAAEAATEMTWEHVLNATKIAEFSLPLSVMFSGLRMPAARVTDANQKVNAQIVLRALSFPALAIDMSSLLFTRANNSPLAPSFLGDELQVKDSSDTVSIYSVRREASSFLTQEQLASLTSSSLPLIPLPSTPEKPLRDIFVSKDIVATV